MLCRNTKFLHSSSNAQTQKIRFELWIRGCRVSRSIFRPAFLPRRTSIIYDVTDIVFSLKQHIPHRSGLFCRSIIIPLPESWPIEICCVSFRLGARLIARPHSWSRGALVRQLPFYGPVSLYLGILFMFTFQGA